MNDSTGLIALFCDIDDFCKTFLPTWHRKQLSSEKRKRCRAAGLCTSELMTILVHFHQSQYRCFKADYLNEVYRHLQGAFPDLPGHTRVVALTPSVLVPLCAYLQQRKNMANHPMPLFDKLLLRKRALIETINDQLKNISQIEHSRHHSVANFMVNLVAGSVAYTHQPKKPSLNLTPSQENQLILV